MRSWMNHSIVCWDSALSSIHIIYALNDGLFQFQFQFRSSLVRLPACFGCVMNKTWYNIRIWFHGNIIVLVQAVIAVGVVVVVFVVVIRWYSLFVVISSMYSYKSNDEMSDSPRIVSMIFSRNHLFSLCVCFFLLSIDCRITVRLHTSHSNTHIYTFIHIQE